MADNMRLLARVRNDVRRRWGGAGVYIAPSVTHSKTLRLSVVAQGFF